MKKFILATLVTIFALVLVACNNGGERKGAKVTIEQTITVTVGKNDKGEDVTEKQKVSQEMVVNPKRIASFSYGVSDMLFQVDLSKAGIEVLGIAKGTSVPSIIGEFNSDKYPNIGTLFEENNDALKLLNPDLIILDGRSSSLYSKLKTAYPNADILDASNTSYSLAKQQEVVEILGKLFPKVKKTLDEKMDAITHKFETFAAITKNHKALFLLSNGEKFSIFGKTGRYGVLHNEFGFGEADPNLKDNTSHGNETGMEYLLELNPEIIFVMDRAAATGGESGLESLKNNPVFKKLDATINNHVYTLNHEAWYLVTGGFTSTELMIKDIELFVNKVK